MLASWSLTCADIFQPEAYACMWRGVDTHASQLFQDAAAQHLDQTLCNDSVVPTRLCTDTRHSSVSMGQHLPVLPAHKLWTELL